jgi:predicted lysophospholipase L1 biosynthesis ABC-type transport system permease subunit
MVSVRSFIESVRAFVSSEARSLVSADIRVESGQPWSAENGNLHVPWHFQPAITIMGIIATTLLVAAVGVLASWDVIARKPITILREE